MAQLLCSLSSPWTSCSAPSAASQVTLLTNLMQILARMKQIFLGQSDLLRGSNQTHTRHASSGWI